MKTPILRRLWKKQQSNSPISTTSSETNEPEVQPEEIQEVQEETPTPETTEPEMQTKKCTKCGRELPITDFYVNKTSKDGRHPYCKECFNKISNENRKKRKRRKAEEEKAKKDSLPWEAILNEPTLSLPEDNDLKEIAKAMNEFKNPAVNEPKAPVKEKTLDDFTPREIFKHLYKLGYRLKDPRGLYCIIKQPVNLEDIICNG